MCRGYLGLYDIWKEKLNILLISVEKCDSHIHIWLAVDFETIVISKSPWNMYNLIVYALYLYFVNQKHTNLRNLCPVVWAVSKRLKYECICKPLSHFHDFKLR